MGAKTSKPSPPKSPEFNRKKSLSNLGRSSQRSAFKKFKAVLHQVNKKLQKLDANDTATIEEMQNMLSNVSRELTEVSMNLKEKHEQQYEEVLKYFQEIKQKVAEKINIDAEQVAELNLKQKSVEKHDNNIVPQPKTSPKKVQLKLIKVQSTENLVDNNDVELRLSKGQEDTTESESVQDLDRERSDIVSSDRDHLSKVKFGIQVMPLNPRVSQEMLKRKTLPSNELPKVEFLEIRELSESEDADIPQDSSILQENREASPGNATNISKEMEAVTKDVDILEEQLKYFYGKKGDLQYVELRQAFIDSLIKLDNVEVFENAVIRQERRILIQRIQELIKILECLDEENDEHSNERPDKLTKITEEIINAEGLPVIATVI